MALFGRGFLAYASPRRLGAGASRAWLATSWIIRLEADTARCVGQNGEEYAVLFHSDTRTTAIAPAFVRQTRPPPLPKMARYLLEVRKKAVIERPRRPHLAYWPWPICGCERAGRANFVGKVRWVERNSFTALEQGKVFGLSQ